MKRISVFIIIVCMTMVSCSLAERITQEEELEEFHFNETLVDIYVDGLGYVYLTIYPRDILDYENVQYEVDNSDVISLCEANNNGVVFYGKAPGVAIITAKINKQSTKVAVTVKEFD